MAPSSMIPQKPQASTFKEFICKGKHSSTGEVCNKPFTRLYNLQRHQATKLLRSQNATSIKISSTQQSGGNPKTSEFSLVPQRNLSLTEGLYPPAPWNLSISSFDYGVFSSDQQYTNLSQILPAVSQTTFPQTPMGGPRVWGPFCSPAPLNLSTLSYGRNAFSNQDSTEIPQSQMVDSCGPGSWYPSHSFGYNAFGNRQPANMPQISATGSYTTFPQDNIVDSHFVRLSQLSAPSHTLSLPFERDVFSDAQHTSVLQIPTKMGSADATRSQMQDLPLSRSSELLSFDQDLFDRMLAEESLHPSSETSAVSSSAPLSSDEDFFDQMPAEGSLHSSSGTSAISSGAPLSSEQDFFNQMLTEGIFLPSSEILTARSDVALPLEGFVDQTLTEDLLNPNSGISTVTLHVPPSPNREPFDRILAEDLLPSSSGGSTPQSDRPLLFADQDRFPNNEATVCQKDKGANPEPDSEGAEGFLHSSSEIWTPQSNGPLLFVDQNHLANNGPTICQKDHRTIQEPKSEKSVCSNRKRKCSFVDYGRVTAARFNSAMSKYKAKPGQRPPAPYLKTCVSSRKASASSRPASQTRLARPMNPYSTYECNTPLSTSFPDVTMDSMDHFANALPAGRKGKPDLICKYCPGIKGFTSIIEYWSHIFHNHEEIDRDIRLTEITASGRIWRQDWEDCTDGGKRDHRTMILLDQTEQEDCY